MSIIHKQQGDHVMKVVTLIHLYVFLLAALVMNPSIASEMEEVDIASIVRGGRLYDNWQKEIKATAPKEEQRAYPSDKAFANDPENNWRCKECHGWDYLGKEGAYGQGRHFTGIKGIREIAGAPIEDIVTILKDNNHGYNGLLNGEDLKDLANFVSKGQIDMDAFIERTTRKARGDSYKHKEYYETICANCHGSNGKKISTMPPLGKIAKNNPWEALHKILNGHPDEEMPALRVLNFQILVDVLSFTQTLPSER